MKKQNTIPPILVQTHEKRNTRTTLIAVTIAEVSRACVTSCFPRTNMIGQIQHHTHDCMSDGNTRTSHTHRTWKFNAHRPTVNQDWPSTSKVQTHTFPIQRKTTDIQQKDKDKQTTDTPVHSSQFQSNNQSKTHRSKKGITIIAANKKHDSHYHDDNTIRQPPTNATTE